MELDPAENSTKSHQDADQRPAVRVELQRLAQRPRPTSAQDMWKRNGDPRSVGDRRQGPRLVHAAHARQQRPAGLVQGRQGQRVRQVLSVCSGAASRSPTTIRRPRSSRTSTPASTSTTTSSATTTSSTTARPARSAGWTWTPGTRPTTPRSRPAGARPSSTPTATARSRPAGPSPISRSTRPRTIA